MPDTTRNPLPSPDELRDTVEAEICEESNCCEQTLLIARSLIAQVRERLFKDGIGIECEVALPEEMDWLLKRRLFNLLFAYGWYLNDRKSEGPTLKWSTPSSRKDEEAVLPTYWEVYRSVDAEIRESMSEEELSRGRKLAVALLFQAAEQIRADGSFQFSVVYDADEHWLNVRDAEQLLAEAGWFVFAQKGYRLKLSTNEHNADPTDYVLTPTELRQSVIADMRSRQSEQERGLAHRLAASALAEIRQTVLANGTSYEYEARLDGNLSWLILDDAKKLLENAGWFVFAEKPRGRYKIRPDDYNRQGPAADIPSPCQIRTRVETEIRESQSDDEKQAAARIASTVIDAIGDQIRESGSNTSYTVPLDEDVHWLTVKDARALLDEAGWSSYRNGDGSLRVSKKNSGLMPFF